MIKTLIKHSFLYKPLKAIVQNLRDRKTESLLDKRLKRFSAVTGKKILFLLTPEYGNLGDHLIAVAANGFFAKFLPDYTICEIPLDDLTYKSGKILSKFSKNFDYVVITGGGFLGSLYLRVEIFFRMVLQSFAENKVIVLPQTIYFADNETGHKEQIESKKAYQAHKDLKFFIRDSSFSFVKNEMLADWQTIKNVPDIALFENFSGEETKRNGVLFCFRNDKEKIIEDSSLELLKETVEKLGLKINYTDTVVDYLIPVAKRGEEVAKKAFEFKSSSLAVTDRLHGMIFATITGTPCVALNNSTGKIKGVYDLWFKEIPYIKFVEKVSEITPELIEGMKNLPPQKYNPDMFETYWNEIRLAFDK